MTDDGQQWVQSVVIPPATQSASVWQIRVVLVSMVTEGAQAFCAPVQ